MPAGQLRHTVDVIGGTVTSDGQGGSTSTPGVVVAAWPMAIDAAPPQWRVAQVTGAAVTEREWIVATCRPHPAIGVGAVLDWRGGHYHVRGVQDVHGRGHWYVIAADRVLE